MSYKTLDVRVDDRGVAYVSLNRPDKRNSLSEQMIEDLTRMAGTLGADPAVRAVVLSGAGEVFCAGGDLTWMKAQIEADRATRIREARKLALMLNALNTVPKPLIGRIHGGAFGGGVGLTCVCDVAIAETATRFGLTETRLGLIPATIGPYVVARMGEGNARRVFMSARLFDADEAAALGIVARAVPNVELDDAVEAEIQPYLLVAPGAVAAAKKLVRSLGPRIDETVIDDTIRRLADTWEGPEARAGIMAFLEKKVAPWAPGGHDVS
ncbi:crotonase/enoyl-CoA hydratase family protein [Pseudorhizobium flavum]|uniref:Methylglutaconyl-CoA hydratase n=1 Tax=Pseudorhizobium flavum TaxID=1335061 RepID=A0A7X0DEB6_9HYPH|nr:crotonase/enoyl-CoA hydratase family protein [Pseudorhizobium flavum]MBB6181757.1 methylglutaconyl-CoA hydratase [Pseudorhizobium flavum]CAD6616354.1 enoyl-CoA hydratase [Pseudorhizobium flavum]